MNFYFSIKIFEEEIQFLICYFVLYNVFFESENKLNKCILGLRNYQ